MTRSHKGTKLARFSKEKRSYWERRLHEYLRPIPIEDLLVMSWAIEAMRDGRENVARRQLEFPGGSNDHEIGGKFFIPPWSIDAVLREKLSLGPTTANAKRLNLSSWNGVVRLLNTYSGLSNIESVMDYSPSDILAAMPRLFWPQYDWQLGTSNMFRLGRAWRVYATEEGKVAFEEKHGIDLETFLKVAFGIYVGSEEHPAVRSSFLASLGVTRKQLHQMRIAIGDTFEGHQAWTKSTGNPDIPRDFLRSVTKEKPLFEVTNSTGVAYVVPCRSNLLLRITDGLYYDIVSDDHARRRSGEAFEALSLELVRHYIGADSCVKPERETTYGVSADILVEHIESSTGLIIECKIRRIPQRVLTSPDPFRDCADAFDDVVKGIVQVWRTYHDLYGKLPMDMTGVVLQYDPWTVMGNAFIKQLFDFAHEKADRHGIPREDRIPVALIGHFDFEISLRDYSYHDVFEAIRDWGGERFQGWELSGVLKESGKTKRPKPAFNYGESAEMAVPWWGDQH